MSLVADLLHAWISRQSTSEGLSWLKERLAAVSQGDRKALSLAFGMVPRKLGKAILQLSPADLTAAEKARTHWNPSFWSIDQAARTLLLLQLSSLSEKELSEILDRMLATAEMGELIALYQALPLLPHPQSHELRCAEGIRTNIKAVFCAIAHHNPLPAEVLSEERWNQMVLKCLFVGVPLAPVIGLDQRANLKLSGDLVLLAHERWAAGRMISPEAWRCVGPFAAKVGFAELEKMLTTGTEPERQAAALALKESAHPGAHDLLSRFPDLHHGVKSAAISWHTIAQSAYEIV